MADKMMRIAGRGEDGNAKAVKTDNDGYVLSRPMGETVLYERTCVVVESNGVADFTYLDISSPYFTVSITFGDDDSKGITPSISYYTRGSAASSRIYLDNFYGDGKRFLSEKQGALSNLVY